MSFAIRRMSFQLQHMLPGWPWISFWTTLTFNCLVYKTEWWWRWDCTHKVFSTKLVIGMYAKFQLMFWPNRGSEVRQTKSLFNSIRWVHRIISLLTCLKNVSDPFPTLLKQDTFHRSVRTLLATSFSNEFCIITVLVKKIELTLNVRWKAWPWISSSAKLQALCQFVPWFPHLSYKHDPCSSQRGDQHVVNFQFLSSPDGLSTINCLLQRDRCTHSHNY